MNRRKTKQPSSAQLVAIGMVDAECRRLGATCCKRPDGISDRTWSKCYEMGYIETAEGGKACPLVRVGSHGLGWLRVPQDDYFADATIRVPSGFFLDHEERDCEPYCKPVRRTRQHVWLRFDDPGLDELLDDARHYATPDQFGEWGGNNRGLIRSAAATVKAIESALASKATK